MTDCVLPLRPHFPLPRGRLRVLPPVRPSASLLSANGRQNRMLGPQHSRPPPRLLHVCPDHLQRGEGDAPRAVSARRDHQTGQKNLNVGFVVAGVWVGHPVLRVVPSGAAQREAEDPARRAQHGGEEDDPQPPRLHQQVHLPAVPLALL